LLCNPPRLVISFFQFSAFSLASIKCSLTLTRKTNPKRGALRVAVHYLRRLLGLGGQGVRGMGWRPSLGLTCYLYLMIWIADVTGITEVWIAAAGGGVLSFWGGPNLCFFRHAASPAEALGGLIFLSASHVLPTGVFG
jgi:hypothetical protein